jgi:hypothetical protein
MNKDLYEETYDKASQNAIETAIEGLECLLTEKHKDVLDTMVKECDTFKAGYETAIYFLEQIRDRNK